MNVRWRNAIFSLALAAASLVVSLLLMELGIRWLIGSPLPERMPLSRVRPDPDVGWTMVPGDVHYTYQHRVQLNELGFRGPPVGPKKKGEYRILFLGDSHIYGQGISDGDLMSTLVEAALARKSLGCTVRVINLGVRAYSINQELELLRLIGLPLQPDRVMLFPYINDFVPVDVKRRFEMFRHLDWYMFDISGKPQGEALRKWERRQWLRKSAFLMWAHDQFTSWQQRGNIEELLLTGRTNGATGERITQMLGYLDGFVRLAERAGFVLDLAPIPAAPEIAETFQASFYRPTIERFAARHGIGYVDLLPSLRELHKENGRMPVIAFDGHYDAHGHSEMAAAIVEYLSLPLRACTDKQLVPTRKD